MAIIQSPYLAPHLFASCQTVLAQNLWSVAPSNATAEIHTLHSGCHIINRIVGSLYTSLEGYMSTLKGFRHHHGWAMCFLDPREMWQINSNRLPFTRGLDHLSELLNRLHKRNDALVDAQPMWCKSLSCSDSFYLSATVEIGSYRFLNHINLCLL